jgi:hypothetical protein
MAFGFEEQERGWALEDLGCTVGTGESPEDSGGSFFYQKCFEKELDAGQV